MPSVFFISLMSASPWGGSEELWYKTAMLAITRGWKTGCAVYHWPQKEIRLKEFADRGGEIIYFPNKGRNKKTLAERIQNKISKIRIKQVINSLPLANYDIVVLNMGAFEITMPAWRNFFRQMEKYIVLYHNYREGEIFTGVKKLAVQNFSHHARMNLFASRRIKEVLEEKSGIMINRAGILLNPISFLPPTQPHTYPSTANGYRFVMLAALETGRKAQDELINALAAEKWRRRNWTLHLYGEGKDKEKLNSLINMQKLQDRVFLEGQTTDVKTVLENAHILLQLTHQDAMPLSVVEAMAMARPVAATGIGDMPYWVKDGNNGWISRNATAAEIDITLEKAWQEREDWKSYGESSFRIFKEKFPLSVEEDLLEKIRSLI